jgi:hypothetical protein
MGGQLLLMVGGHLDYIAYRLEQSTTQAEIFTVCNKGLNGEPRSRSILGNSTARWLLLGYGMAFMAYLEQLHVITVTTTLAKYDWLSPWGDGRVKW